MDALRKGVLWLSSPDKFNDPYDAAVSFDSDRFLIEDQSIQAFLSQVNESERIVKEGGIGIQEKLFTLYVKTSGGEKYFLSYVKIVKFQTKVSFSALLKHL
jgi:hypothetical protein